MSAVVGFKTSMASKDLNLTKLVNLALSSSPKVGIVNFNVLKTFLLELINALNLQNYEPKFGDETKNLVEDAIKNESQHDEILNLINENSIRNDLKSGVNETAEPKTNISILTADMKPITLERFHKLEGKLNRMENQLSTINTLPSNQHLIDKTKDMKKSPGGPIFTGPIMEAWQYTQLSKRLESNEEGLTKLTSLLQDVIGDMNDLREVQSKQKDDLREMGELNKSVADRMVEAEKLIAELVRGIDFFETLLKKG